jgi:hypothetical protein
MHGLWITAASICIGVPISYKWRLTLLLTGMFCAGLNIILSLIIK